MAKYDKYDESDGVWRTVGGRRIFIKTGQSLESAMKESGKFKNKSKAEKMNETMDKRQKIIEKLDKETEELEEYDKYNLAISKLENEDYSTPTERQYWVGVKDRYLKMQENRGISNQQELQRLKRQEESMLNAYGKNKDNMGQDYCLKKYKEASNYRKEYEEKIRKRKNK